MGNPYQLLFDFRYVVFLPLAILEGPIVTVVAAFMASLNLFNIYVIYGLAVLGDVLGDILHYAAGRIGRESLIPKYGHWIGLTKDRIEQTDHHFKEHLGKTILFGKITQAPNFLILIMAGVTRSDFWRFLSVVTLASFPKALVFTVIGYYFGKSYTLINQYFDSSILASAVVIVLVGILLGVHRYVRKAGANT